jgi:hypothetical protein
MNRGERNEQDEQTMEIDRIERGGNAWQGTEEAAPLEVKQPLDKVIPVRLSADHWESLRTEAQELGVGPTTLVRMWVLEKLRNRRRSPHVA